MERGLLGPAVLAALAGGFDDVPELRADHRGSIDGFMDNHPLDTVALRMKAIRELNKAGVRKPTQDQIRNRMKELVGGAA